MSVWLYQMSERSEWRLSDYRSEVREGEATTWDWEEPYRYYLRGHIDGVEDGDTIVLFFAKTDAVEPGICGIGTVREIDLDLGVITFKAEPPTDYLKLNPLWDEEVESLMNQIRGAMKQGTLWYMTPEEMEKVQAKIKEHVASARK